MDIQQKNEPGDTGYFQVIF